MAQISIAEIYSGEKYDVMSAAMAEYLKDGRPAEYDERTWIDMLLVKHTLNAADKMKMEGDTVSGMADNVSPSSYVRWDDDNACRLYYGNIIPHERSIKRGSAYSEVLGYVVRNEDDLKATLTEQQKEIFEKLKDCESEQHGMNEIESFVSGFKLAARIIIEVLQEPPKA